MINKGVKSNVLYFFTQVSSLRSSRVNPVRITQCINSPCPAVQNCVLKSDTFSNFTLVELPVFLSSFEEVFPERSHDSGARGDKPPSRNYVTVPAWQGVAKLVRRKVVGCPACDSVRPVRPTEGGGV